MQLAHPVRIVRELAAIARIAGYRVALRYAAAILQSLTAIIGTSSLAPADERMCRLLDTLRVRICGVELVLPGRCFAAAREMYARNVYLRPPGFSIAAGDTVVDLGCNEGLFSLLAAALGARVIAVDVQGGFVVPLREHLARNGCDAGSVTFRHALVGGDTGLFASTRAGSHYTSVPPRATLDAILAGVEHVRLMKVDIEGSEFALFSGDGAEWVRKVDRIAMEVHPGFGDPATLAGWLEANGYSALIHEEGYIYATRRAPA